MTSPNPLPVDVVSIGPARLRGTAGAIVLLGAATALAVLVARGQHLNLAPAIARAASRVAGVTPQGFAAVLTILMSLAAAALGVAIARRTWRAPVRTIVTLSPDGLLDTRLTPQLLSWRAIQSIDEWNWQGRRGIVLKIDPAILATLALPADLRDGRRLGLKAVPFPTRDLDRRYATCLGLLKDHQAAYGQRP